MTGFLRSIATPTRITPQVQRIRQLAARSPDRFAQTQLPVKTKLAGIQPFTYNWTQREIARCIAEERAQRKAVRLYFLKSRRVGSSTAIVMRFFVLTWALDDIEALILSQQEERSEELLEKVKFAYAMLPKELKMALSKDSKSGLAYADTRAKITIASARNLAVARGGTKQLLLLSEFAFYKKAREILKEFLSPMAPAFGTEAIIETTGNGFGSDAHELWLDSRRGRTVWRAEFLDWRKDPECDFQFESDKDRDYKLMEALEFEPRLLDRMRFFKMTPGQIYHSYLILKGVCDGDYSFYLRDYPADETECWMSNKLSFFGNENVQKLQQVSNDFTYQTFVFGPQMPLDRHIAEQTDFHNMQQADRIDDKGSRPYIRVWRMPRHGHLYLVSGDSGEGAGGGDPSSSFVIDIETVEMMAEFHGLVRPEEHAYVMAMLGNIYNEALQVPELNPPGNLTFYILSGITTNMYRWRHPLMDNVNEGKNMSQKMGWVTTSLSRSTMLGTARRIVEDLAHGRLQFPGIIKSRALLDEMSTFAPDDQGRAEAINGAFDDRVIAWAIAITVAAQEMHGSARDMFTLYDKTQVELEDPQAQSVDPLLFKREPRDVIEDLLEQWNARGPQLWTPRTGFK